MQTLRLCNDNMAIEISPEVGGGLTRFDRIAGNRIVPLFRPWSPSADARPNGALPDPNELACYPLVPWSNRIAGGVFVHEGRTIRLPRNRSGEPCPIHGDGWLSAWAVEHADQQSATLVLDHADGAPYSYRARQTYALHEHELTIDLEVENTGTEEMPFGLGVHPFLPRDPDTQLAAPASGVWLSGDDRLPQTSAMVPGSFCFAHRRSLPDTLVDHVFMGWSGQACMDWTARGVSLLVASDARYYVLYAPPGGDFFCFEPVDHAINAPNLPGGARAHGMTVLAPGETLARRFSFAVVGSCPD